VNNDIMPLTEKEIILLAIIGEKDSITVQIVEDCSEGAIQRLILIMKVLEVDTLKINVQKLRCMKRI